LIYEARLNVPAGTTQADPVSTRVILTRGVIVRFGWLWPTGTKQLGHAVVEYLGQQIFPLNLGGTLTDNGLGPEFPCWQPLRARPYEVVVKAWAPTATNDHTLTVRFALLPWDQAYAPTRLARTMAKLHRLWAQTLVGETPPEEGEEHE